MAQWDTLRRTYVGLGHTVEVIAPVPGLPDMVFAANGGTVVDGVVLPARFRHAERVAEGPAYRTWFLRNGFRVGDTAHVNEGEGDFLVNRDHVLAGTGFRTAHAAHDDAQELFGRPVVTLRLVDPRFYHLDVALAVLDDETVAYYPGAFSDGSRAVLERLYPHAVIAEEADALVLGLNAVSDGLQRRAAHCGNGSGDGALSGAWLRPGPGRPVRAAQGRRQRQVLHPRDPLTVRRARRFR